MQGSRMLAAQPIDADLLAGLLDIQRAVEATLRQDESISLHGRGSQLGARVGTEAGQHTAKQDARHGGQRRQAGAAAVGAHPAVHELARAAVALQLHRARVVVLLALGAVETLRGGVGSSAVSRRQPCQAAATAAAVRAGCCFWPVRCEVPACEERRSMRMACAGMQPRQRSP